MQNRRVFLKNPTNRSFNHEVPKNGLGKGHGAPSNELTSLHYQNFQFMS